MKKLICMLLFICMASLLCAPALAANSSTVVYTAIITKRYGDSVTKVYADADTDAKVLAVYSGGQKLDVVDVLPNWVVIKYKNTTGYVLRHRVDNVVAVDQVNTAPYGVEVYRYFTTLSQTVDVHAEANSESDVLITLNEGAKLAFITVENGWAKLVFHRQYAYVDTRLLPALEMTASTPEEGTADTPIAVFMSFYKITTNDLNLGRMENLRVGCERMNRVMQTGELLDFNAQVGPFTAGNGYKPAPVLINGETKPGYGGGSCQISSTLYNTVLQVQGITVVERHPHGNNGASYLPHGMDASSGDLNFRIRNDYEFPISITSHVQDGALYIAIYKGEV